MEEDNFQPAVQVCLWDKAGLFSPLIRPQICQGKMEAKTLP